MLKVIHFVREIPATAIMSSTRAPVAPDPDEVPPPAPTLVAELLPE
jgi:hypothetical protein